MVYNEADTRANLIDPKLNIAGWTRSQVTREHFYRPDYQYTAGRVVLRGDRAERQPPRRVDYLLRYTDPRIFRVPPFSQMGDVRGVIRRFGGDPDRLRQTLGDLQRRLYAA